MRNARVLHRQRGLSLVELMVGITVGLFIVAAAVVLTTNHLDDNRRLLLETQVHQDMRSAMDMVTREVRRSGFWSGSASGVWTKDNQIVQVNPETALMSGSPPQPLAEGAPVDNLTLDYKAQQAGFKLDADGAIYMLIGGAWQQLTDPVTLNVQVFNVALTTQTIDLTADCLQGCAPGVGAPCPQQLVRSLDITLAGRARHDERVARTLTSRVRLPNDVLVGACPPVVP